jgi:hypothetical protein
MAPLLFGRMSSSEQNDFICYNSHHEIPLLDEQADRFVFASQRSLADWSSHAPSPPWLAGDPLPEPGAGAALA